MGELELTVIAKIEKIKESIENIKQDYPDYPIEIQFSINELNNAISKIKDVKIKYYVVPYTINTPFGQDIDFEIVCEKCKKPTETIRYEIKDDEKKLKHCERCYSGGD